MLALGHAEKLRSAEAIMPSVGDLSGTKHEPEPEAAPAELEAPPLRLARLPAMTNPSGS